MNSFDGIVDIYDGNEFDFDAAQAQGVGAIWHQSTRGIYKKDAQYGTRKKEALKRGFLWGAFHLLSPEDSQKQVDFLLAAEDSADPTVAIALDWEPGFKGTMPLDQLHDFLQRLYGKIGRYPVLYGGRLLRETREIKDGDDLLAKCPLWYARYTNGDLEIPTRTWPNYTLWQFDDEKRQYGAPPKEILPGADWSTFKGSLADLKAQWPFSRPSGRVQITTPIGADASAAAATAFGDAAKDTASSEWNFFGQQTYDTEGHPSHSGHKEGEDGFYQRVGKYWLEALGDQLDGRDHDMPWSAAFISWVMKTSGAGQKFRYSAQHSTYISRAIKDFKDQRQDAGYWGRRLNEHKPVIGDIVCWGREDGIDYDHQAGGQYKGHCDIVVEVNGGSIQVIGGNVGDSVTKRPLPLDANGYLKPVVQNGENLFAVMQNRIDTSAPVS